MPILVWASPWPVAGPRQGVTPPIGLPGCCAPCLASLSACSLPKSPEWALAQWYWTGRPMSLSHHLAVSSAFWTVRAGGLADVAA